MRRGFVIVLGGPVLFFAHGIVYGVCATAGGLVLLPNRLDWKQLEERTQGSLGLVTRSHSWYLLRQLSPPP
jgi:hypothetical protein